MYLCIMIENEFLGIVIAYLKEIIFENIKLNSIKNHSKLKST